MAMETCPVETRKLQPLDVFALGDSPNDVSMFGYFPHSVGVANILKFRGRLQAEPAYVTPSEGGDGFAELARAILATRTTT